MRRLSVRGMSLLGALVLLALLTTNQVNASIVWCKADPTVSIDGRVIDINVYSTEEILTHATGPTTVRIKVPTGVSTELIAEEEGFGFGWNVSFEEDDDLRVTKKGAETKVIVVVPSRGGLPAKVELVQQGEIIEREVGETNERMSARAWI